jgi:hypothetical protein
MIRQFSRRFSEPVSLLLTAVLPDRVTRVGEFSHVGWLRILGSFSKRSAHFWATFCRTLPSPPKFGNDCQPHARALPLALTFFLLISWYSSRAHHRNHSINLHFYNYNFTIAILQLQFTSLILWVQIYNCNLQASLNHRANACSCSIMH